MKTLLNAIYNVDLKKCYKIIPLLVVQTVCVILVASVSLPGMFLSAVIVVMLIVMISSSWLGGHLVGLLVSVVSSMCWLFIFGVESLDWYIFITVGLSIMVLRLKTEREIEKNQKDFLETRKELTSLREIVACIEEMENKIDRSQRSVGISLQDIQSMVRKYSEKADSLFFSSLKLSSKMDNTQEELVQLINTVDEIQNSTHVQAEMVENNTHSQEKIFSNLGELKTKVTQAYEINSSLNENAAQGKERIKDAIKSIQELSMNQQKSLEVVSMISDVVEKTNVLAMNATIQAVHAGKAGRGFAVVAQEVRKLADETGERATDITQIIQNMNNKIGKSIQLIQSVGNSIETILSKIMQVYPLITEISGVMEILLDDDVTVREVITKIRESMVNIRDNAYKEGEIAAHYKDTFSQLKSYFEMLTKTIDDLKDHNQKSEEILFTVREIQEENYRLKCDINELVAMKV